MAKTRNDEDQRAIIARAASRVAPGMSADEAKMLTRRPRAAKVLTKAPGPEAVAVQPKCATRAMRTPELEVALGARIRAARIAARMTQTALAEAVGISFQQVQKYELGKDRVAASTLQGLAEAMGTHPATFFGDVSVPVGPVPQVKAAIRAGDVLQQIRNPRVLKQLLALARVLADVEEDTDSAEVLPSPSKAN